MKTPTSAQNALISAAAVLAAAAGAAAQCDWLIPNVPDFDQERVATPTHPGLPGDGLGYCVPTNAVNWMAYIANHGRPSLMGGTHQWQSNSNYDLVTSRISQMSVYTGNPQGPAGGGTNQDGLHLGLLLYELQYAPGTYDVSTNGVSYGYYPVPADLWFPHQLGALELMSYGRYTEDPPGFYTRTGGHETTLIGMSGFCSGGHPTVIYRNSADDADQTSAQSPFKQATTELAPISAFFRTDASLPYEFHTEYRFEHLYPAHNVFLGNIASIWAPFGLTTGTSLAPDIRVVRPTQIGGVSMPALQVFQTPTGGVVRDLVMHPRMTSYYYITGPVGATPAKVWRMDALSGQSTEITGYAAPTRLFLSRQGELYVLDGATLSWVNPEPPPGTTGRGVSVSSQGIDTLTYDDLSDTVAGLDVSGRRIVAWHHDLNGGVGFFALPAEVCLSGRASISMSPTNGSLWVCSAGCPAIYKMVGTPLAVADMITLPTGSNPTGLNIGRQHVFFSSGGVVHEMEKTGGVWIDTPGSNFAGGPAGTLFCLSKSRTNFDDTMNLPGSADITDPPVGPETLDCYANCDWSTAVPALNVNDFICFMGQFAAGAPEANCDDSTSVPVLTVNDFICFQGRFAAGCP